MGRTILLLSNHRVDLDYLGRLAAATPETVFILWSFFDVLDRIPFKRWILTSEQYIRPPTMEGHLANYQKALALGPGRYIPLGLRVPESPTSIGSWPRADPPTLTACFMGSPYKAQWTARIPNILYHNIQRDGLLTAAARRANYLRSMFALGFHSDENVRNNHVTQRVFEGMAYGCVVLSDNPAAALLTDGIVEYVGSAAEVEERIAYFLWNPDLVAAKQAAGYEWCRKYGTNRWAARQFLDAILDNSDDGLK
jgi:glycosyltransferase involved in cell wall biosynthesis